MKKVFFLLIAGLLIVQSASAQDNSVPMSPPSTPRNPSNNYRDKPPLKERIFFGGNVGLSFGDVTFVDLEPTVGYKFTDKFGAGLGPSYSYIKDNRQGAEFTSNSYGGRIFAQYKVIPRALAYTEFNMVNADAWDEFKYQWVRVNIPAFLVGGAYVEPISDRASFMIMALWDLEGSRYSYQQNPIIRGGINFGF